MKKEKTPEAERAAEIVHQPHFDEEWTILTARPVVPLKRRERTPVFGETLRVLGAFVGASFLGVVVALALIGVREVVASILEVNALAQNQPSSQDAPHSDQTAIVPKIDPSFAAATKAVQLIEASKHQSPKIESLSQEANGQALDLSDRRARLQAEWQGQRPRRTTIRRRQRGRYDIQQRDLLRIDEIFEGHHQ